MLNEKQKEQVAIDFAAAGFARKYGGSIGDPQDFGRLFSGIVMEATHDILARQKIKLTNKPQQRNTLLSAVGQLYYHSYAAALTAAEDPDGQGSSTLIQRARGLADGIIRNYPGSRAQALCEGVAKQIGRNWPVGDMPFPIEVLNEATYVDKATLAAAATPSTDDFHALRRMNYYQTMDSVILTDGALGARNKDMFEGMAEKASLGWLGKSAMEILASTLPGKQPDVTSVNDLAIAYSACIVNAKWFSQPLGQRNNIAVSKADTLADETSAKLQAAFAPDELKKLAATIFERTISGPKIAPADQVALKAYVYKAVGADMDDTAPGSNSRPGQGPKNDGGIGRKPR